MSFYLEGTKEGICFNAHDELKNMKVDQPTNVSQKKRTLEIVETVKESAPTTQVEQVVEPEIPAAKKSCTKSLAKGGVTLTEFDRHQGRMQALKYKKWRENFDRKCTEERQAKTVDFWKVLSSAPPVSELSPPMFGAEYNSEFEDEDDCDDDENWGETFRAGLEEHERWHSEIESQREAYESYGEADEESEFGPGKTGDYSDNVWNS